MERSNLWAGLLLAVSLVALVAGGVRLTLDAGREEEPSGRDGARVLSALLGGPLAPKEDGVAVLSVVGPIGFASEDAGPFSALQPGAERIVRKLDEYTKEDKVKALVLKVNSPGGSLAASQAVGSAVARAVAAGKPVVVSMGDVAASGGYYIAAPATKIVAHPGTITGSIGVIVTTPNLVGLMDRWGVRMNAFTSGANKDTLAFWREPRPDEVERVQALVNAAYEQFLDTVVAGRKLDKESLRKLADGRIMLGSQAKEAGLVDELGTFHDALRLAARLGGLETDEPHVIGEGENLFDKLSFTLGTLTRVVGSRDGALQGLAGHGVAPLGQELPVAYRYLPSGAPLPSAFGGGR